VSNKNIWCVNLRSRYHWIEAVQSRLALNIQKLSVGVMKFFLASAIFGLVGCSWTKSQKPSVLLIAVESLPFQSFSCEGPYETEVVSGFKRLCEEAVRFTHAYTPSLMSQATLVSLLTARLPFETGVWHNGSQFLSSSAVTVPELAVEKGYRTSLFSGGPPIWKKSGLDQGFELFEDNISVSLEKYYRPAVDTLGEFLAWREREVGGSPFFSVIYLADLQFFDISTVDSEGRPVDRSYSGRLKKLDLELGQLFDQMRKSRRWDNCYVVLVGLNGRVERERPYELPAFSLHSENTQVVLMIKPPRKKRDLGLAWKIDKNVSLVDVGATLFEIFKSKPITHQNLFKAVSLKSALDSTEADWLADRAFLMESAWPQWHGLGRTRFAVKKGNYLYIHDRSQKIYNTLTDRMETAPMHPEDETTKVIQSDFNKYFENFGFAKWPTINKSIPKKLSIARHLWQEFHPEYESISHFKKVPSVLSKSRQVVGWQAVKAIHLKDWKALLEMGLRFKEPTWSYVASKNLKKRHSLPWRGCFRLLAASRMKLKRVPTPKECDDEIFKELYLWITLKKAVRKATYHKERFLRLFSQALLDRKIAELNYVNGLMWDVPVDRPKGPFLSELLLSLPDNKKYLKATQRRLKKYGK